MTKSVASTDARQREGEDGGKSNAREREGGGGALARRGKIGASAGGYGDRRPDTVKTDLA